MQKKHIVIFLVALLFLLTPLKVPSTHTNKTPVLHPTVFAPDSAAVAANLSAPPPPASSAPSNNVAYDEQVGETYTQGFTSILVNVTAVAQTDPNTGTGPAYMLNGLTDSGYWYQIGIAYNWPTGTGSGYNPGFYGQYDVFNPKGSVISPQGGGGGQIILSGSVNNGDTVALNLYFNDTTGVVEMVVNDLNTGAYGNTSYWSMGATKFVGLNGPSNSQGFFTGLMTEWYRGTPYYGNEGGVPYFGSPIASAYLWADEWNYTTSSSTTIFHANKYYSFSGAPGLLQGFSTNGISEYASSYELVTGEPTAAMTHVNMVFSYKVLGSATGYNPPVLTYTIDGTVKTTILSTIPTNYTMDADSQWSVTNVLVGSTQTARWATTDRTNGTASPNIAEQLTYYYQEKVVFQLGGSLGGGYSNPTVRYESFGANETTGVGDYVWADEGSPYSFVQTLPGSTQSVRWFTPTPLGTVKTSQTITGVYYEQYMVSVNAIQNTTPIQIPVEYVLSGQTLSGHTPLSTWMDSGSQYHVMALNSTATRYIFNGSEPVSETVIGPMTATYYLYQQSKLSVSTFDDGTSIPITYTSLGRNLTAYDNATVWADQGTSITVPGVINEATGVRLVATGATTTFRVTGPGTYSITFEKEVLVRFVVNETPGAMLNGTIVSTGNSTDITFNSPIWALIGSTYNIASPIYSLNGAQRIVITPSSGVLDRPGPIPLATQTQDMIIETTEAGTGASTTQWANNTQAVSLTAPKITAWKFAEWVGSVNSSSQVITIQPAPGAKETAVYLPEVNITASSGGSISITYDGNTSVIPSGRSSTFYVPVGTVVAFNPEPSNPLYRFSRWIGGGSMAGSAVTISGPVSITGVFRYNLVVIGVMTGIIALASLVVGLIARAVNRRRRYLFLNQR
jgi:hypothetical protein